MPLPSSSSGAMGFPATKQAERGVMRRESKFNSNSLSLTDRCATKIQIHPFFMQCNCPFHSPMDYGYQTTVYLEWINR